MGKNLYLTITLLLLFFPKISIANPNPCDWKSSCPLPPPAQISIVGITSSSISLTWTASPGAAMYKVSVYDQTDQVSLPDTYTASTAVEIGELDTDAHEYIIGVSASACIGGGFGDETITDYKPGIIIIVDVIIQMNCPGPGQSFPPNTNPIQINLPFNLSSKDVIDTKRIRITSNNNPNSDYVDFLIWTDCYQQYRFYEIAKQGVKRTSLGNTIKYSFNSNLSPFFEITSGTCDINLCTATIKYYVPCLIGQSDCEIQNTPSTCGGKPDNNIQLFVSQLETANYSTEANTKQSLKALKGVLTQQIQLKASPNPFSDAVNVQYNLENPGLVSINLFNATGAVVRNIVPPQWLESGTYTALLTLQEGLPKGPYFLVLQVGPSRFVIPLIHQ